MRIGIDARFFGVLGKGLGRYTEQLILALERLEESGLPPHPNPLLEQERGKNEYYIFLRKENFDAYVPARPNFHKVLADYQWYSFSEQWGFVWLLWRFRLNLVHFPHFNVPILYTRPFIVTIHDLILRHHPTRKASTRHALFYWAKVVAYRVTIASALFRARSIIAVSKFTRDDLRQQYAFLRRRDIIVTHQAAENFCRWQPLALAQTSVRTVLARAQGLLTDQATGDGPVPRYLLYVGNAYPHKNLERLIRAFGSKAFSDMRLVFVGREDYFYRRLQRLVEKKRVTNCFFVGGATDQELSLLYRFAHGYIFPSLYEGAGLPPLEAMNYGVPTAVTERTSVPEMVGDASLLFDPENDTSIRQAIESLWSNEPLRQSLQTKGYHQSAKFSWNTLARQTLGVYQKNAS
jgi:glycosyltransferase involved in cell wall biosynthesis